MPLGETQLVASGAEAEVGAGVLHIAQNTGETRMPSKRWRSDLYVELMAEGQDRKRRRMFELLH